MFFNNIQKDSLSNQDKIKDPDNFKKDFEFVTNIFSTKKTQKVFNNLSGINIPVSGNFQNEIFEQEKLETMDHNEINNRSK